MNTSPRISNNSGIAPSPFRFLRNIGDMRDVGRDILAHRSVTARCRAHQPPVLIAQTARQSVDLVLRRHRNRRVICQREITPHPRLEFSDLVIGKGVVEAHHPHIMRHLGQWRGGDLMPDATRRAVGPHQMRERRLQLGIAADQRVEFGVGQFGRILGMIKPVGARDRLCQPHQFIGCVSFGDPFHTPSSNRSACARASSVISAPDSIRAISWRRPAASSRTTPVRVTVPSDDLAMT